ncbi:putative 50S ribosomal subunit protein L4 [Candidatus Tremblaya phenacola PAVE]|nr:putative 50S ribosomal subunit protein L4 [Candidatus Tremblaya phenacola PAVE]
MITAIKLPQNQISEWQTVNILYLGDDIFGCDINSTLLTQILLSFQSNSRMIVSSQKGRAEVNHSTKKLYKQKGTGKARAGMSSSPSRRGGGRAFPNSNTESYKNKINKAAFKTILRGLLSILIKQGLLLIVNSIGPNYSWIDDVGSCLIITDPREIERGAHLHCRNKNGVFIISFEEVNPRILMMFDCIIMTERGALQIQGLLR